MMIAEKDYNPNHDYTNDTIKRHGYKLTKIGWIPEEWEQHSLGEVIFSFESGVSVNSEDKRFAGDGCGILKTSAVHNGTFKPSESKQIFESEIDRAKLNPLAGSLLVSRMNTSDLVGACCYIPSDHYNLFIPDRLWLTTCKIKVCDPQWLNYLLNSLKYRSIIKNRATGTSGSMKNISKLSFLSIVIPLPPLPEQQKIAQILSTWDKAISKMEQLIAKKQERKKGLMQQLLTGKKRFKVFVKSDKMKETKLGLIPEDWDFSKVKEITVEHKQGYYTTEDYKESGTYYLLRGTDMKNPKVDLSEAPRIDANNKDYNLFRVDLGDILIVRSGGIGKYGIVSEKLPASIFGSYLIRFRLNEQAILKEFFGLFYESNYSINQLKAIAQGSSNININAENIKSLSVPLPGIDEQVRIVSTLSLADQEISKLKSQLKQLKEQKKGLMQKLLTGEVRVTVDKMSES